MMTGFSDKLAVGDNEGSPVCWTPGNELAWVFQAGAWVDYSLGEIDTGERRLSVDGFMQRFPSVPLPDPEELSRWSEWWSDERSKADWSVAFAADPAIPFSAYLNTDYVVEDSVQFVCRIGERAPEIPSEILPAVFITAWNPFGEILPDDVNSAANELLRSNLALVVETVLSGYGKGRDGIWPAEPSFFAARIDRTRAEALGVLWRQNAVVWIGPDRVPELLITRRE